MSSPLPHRYLHINGEKRKLDLSDDVALLSTYLTEKFDCPLVLFDSAGFLVWRGVVGDYVGDIFIMFLNSPLEMYHLTPNQPKHNKKLDQRELVVRELLRMSSMGIMRNLWNLWNVMNLMNRRYQIRQPPLTLAGPGMVDASVVVSSVTW